MINIDSVQVKKKKKNHTFVPQFQLKLGSTAPEFAEMMMMILIWRGPTALRVPLDF